MQVKQIIISGALTINMITFAMSLYIQKGENSSSLATNLVLAIFTDSVIIFISLRVIPYFINHKPNFQPFYSVKKCVVN